MRFTEIGHQLRQYRMESGLRAEEIAARLGVSRAALYRYEKGEVIKLDTIKRLAELLKISPLALLGIGVEHFPRASGYFERLRQIEETTDQVLQAFGPICYPITSESFDGVLADAYADHAARVGGDGAQARAEADKVLVVLAQRKRIYAQRRPSVIAVMTANSIRRFLDAGVAGALNVSEGLRRRCRVVARAEVENIAALMAAEPMGVQIGLLSGGEPNGAFKILRGRDRSFLIVNPFQLESHPITQMGVAMVTGAEEALSMHQRVLENLWRDAQRGPAAAVAVRALLAEASPP